MTELKKEHDAEAYLPVAYEYKEVIWAEIEKKAVGKVFYFCQSEGICEVKGWISELTELANGDVFLVMGDQIRIRIDRIITLFGKPGAAYGEYELHANACMSCTGGEA